MKVQSFTVIPLVIVGLVASVTTSFESQEESLPEATTVFALNLNISAELASLLKVKSPSSNKEENNREGRDLLFYRAGHGKGKGKKGQGKGHGKKHYKKHHGKKGHGKKAAGHYGKPLLRLPHIFFTAGILKKKIPSSYYVYTTESPTTTSAPETTTAAPSGQISPPTAPPQKGQWIWVQESKGGGKKKHHHGSKKYGGWVQKPQHHKYGWDYDESEEKICETKKSLRQKAKKRKKYLKKKIKAMKKSMKHQKKKYGWSSKNKGHGTSTKHVEEESEEEHEERSEPASPPVVPKYSWESSSTEKDNEPETAGDNGEDESLRDDSSSRRNAQSSLHKKNSVLTKKMRHVSFEGYEQPYFHAPNFAQVSYGNLARGHHQTSSSVEIVDHSRSSSSGRDASLRSTLMLSSDSYETGSSEIFSMESARSSSNPRQHPWPPHYRHPPASSWIFAPFMSK